MNYPIFGNMMGDCLDGSISGRMHYYYSGDIPGALVGVDSGTILASCSSVAEFLIYPCT